MSASPGPGGRVRAIAPDGFRMIPDTLLFDSECIQSIDVRIYGILLWYAYRVDVHDREFPGRKKLAELVGVKSVRTIDSSLERLQVAGYLTITPQFGPDGSQGENDYLLHFTPLPKGERQHRTKKGIQDTAPPLEGGVQQIARGSQTPEKEGVQQIARGGGGAADCTPRGAADCTGPVQQAAHLIRDNFQIQETQPSDPFANAQGSAGSAGAAPAQQSLDGMPEPTKSKRRLAAVPDPRPGAEPDDMPDPPASNDPTNAQARTIARRYWAGIKRLNVPAPADDGTGRATPFIKFVAMVESRLKRGYTWREVEQALIDLLDQNRTFPAVGVLDPKLVENRRRRNGNLPAAQGSRYGRPAPRVHIDDVDQAERSRVAAAFGEEWTGGHA